MKIKNEDKLKTTRQLSKEDIDNINSYESELVTLKDFVTAVRKRPGMYIGYKGDFGFIRITREVLQNAIDEMMRKNPICDRIGVTYFEHNRQMTIEDNGRGIPFNSIIRVFSSQHTSSNYKKKLYDYTSGTNGVGSKVTMALSEHFVVESYILGEARRVEFDNGKLWDEGVKVIPSTGKQGTMVSFIPCVDQSALGPVDVKAETILDLIELLSPLTTIGSVIKFRGTKIDGTIISRDVINEDGILTYLIRSCRKPMFEPIAFSDDNGEMRMSVLCTWDNAAIEDGVPEVINTFANFCPTDSIESSHAKGFISGIKNFFIKYMNTVYLNTTTGNKKQQKTLKIIEADIRTGLRCVVDVACLEPNFTGQAKDVLAVPAMTEYVESNTIRNLEQWAKNNPQQLNKLCKYFKDLALIRQGADEKKINVSKVLTTNIKGLPSNFTEPKTWKELYIVEGDSAGGGCKNNRDVKTQGIMPIRGMMFNCFDQPISKCLQNKEVAAISMLCGYEQGKKYNPANCRWEKVITAGDADSAGAQINSLILRCFLRLMPELISAGKFYRAVVPLYQVRLKGGKKIFFTDRIQLVKWIQSQFSKSNTLSTIDGKKIASGKLEELLYRNIDYIYELNKIAERYKIQPDMLEMYLLNRTKSDKDICKLIKNKYRFMNPISYKLDDGRIISGCEGSVNRVNNLIPFTDRILKESEAIIKILDGNLYDTFLINDKPGTLYDLMSIYEGFSPDNLGRLKGLGEQDGRELAETLLTPGGNRTLIQYSMEDAVKEIDIVRKYESNTSLLLKDLKVTRLDITD